MIHAAKDIKITASIFSQISHDDNLDLPKLLIGFVQMRVYISVQISHDDNLSKKWHKLQEVQNSSYYAIVMCIFLHIWAWRNVLLVFILEYKMVTIVLMTHRWSVRSISDLHL